MASPKSLAKAMKPIKQPPLSKRHKTRRVRWARRCMKTDSRNVLFTDECRANLVGPDGWSCDNSLSAKRNENKEQVCFDINDKHAEHIQTLRRLGPDCSKTG